MADAELKQIYGRLLALPLNAEEKQIIFGSICQLSLEELKRWFIMPDDMVLAGALKRAFASILPGEEISGTKAHWGTPSMLSTAPSSLDNKTCISLQSQKGVLNFRPANLHPKIPLQLAHPAFGTFLDIYHGVPGAARPADVDISFFNTLSVQSSRYYTDEDSQYRPMVHSLWVQYTGLSLEKPLYIGRTQKKKNSETHADIGYALELLGALILIVEAKLGMGGTGTDPAMQATQSTRLYWVKKGDEAKFAGTCYPVLVLEHVGPFIRVSAVANLNKLSFQPLTPFINLLPLQGCDLAAAEQGVRLCFAVKITLLELIDFYGKTAANQLPKVPRAVFNVGLPYPLQGFAKATRWGDKLVYLLQDGDETTEKTVVKYVQWEYGEAVHRAWAQAGFAPQLRSPPRLLPGGFTEIVMEYLSDADGWQSLQSVKEADDLRPQVVDALKKAHKVRVGDSVGVHGDMRDINVMIRKPRVGPTTTLQVKFIDFDWSREEGRGVYPPFMNHKGIKWPAGVGVGQPLLQIHDHLLLSTATYAQTPMDEDEDPDIWAP